MKLSIKEQSKELFWGLLSKFLNLFIPVQAKHWVFGSDYGNQYREGSKYMLEYMLKDHPDYDCTFIYRNKKLKAELEAKGIPCASNFSLKGILAIVKAEAVFCTQYCDDIYFAHPKKSRDYYFLIHGMPYKKAFNAVPDKFKQKYARKESLVRKFGARLRKWLVLAFEMDQVSFVSCCSEFNLLYMPEYFGNKIQYPVLGMPRNDAFFQPERMSKEKWIDAAKGKFVITYMPTHRAYGKGKVTPTPFADRPDVQQWMKVNNVLFVMKNHPNMISLMDEPLRTDTIYDITKDGIDPQVACYYSDVLITDYSSVWMDYLLLRRPIIFYYYDNYEAEDEGLLYNIRDLCAVNECRSEDDLFSMIRRAKEDYDAVCPSDELIDKFHKYKDGLSCQRHFEYIKDYKNQD